ncbi:hypothetical protein Glove_21g179 [Diversispora epigaea]|uniref:Protein kinase domain-containing protein n=1 Tax=Diversispora epigaea TaxID=1348612 RepID=A0A397JTU9_9GLOM|nr:hypothetical protein Glove_21g179 [Diversispora epigaea]
MVLCEECNREYTWHNWCKPCNSKHFKNNFDKWTSGNEKIDIFIRDSQLNADSFWAALIEWIPYDRFKSIKKIAKGGFGTIYYAKWIDKRIKKWDIENQQWKRYKNRGKYVVLKKFDDFGNSDEEFLNVLAIHLKAMDVINGPIRIFGITKDPDSNKYMMVLAYMRDGNLREYLKDNFEWIYWNDKLFYLLMLAYNFACFHRLDIIHQNFHPGNILSHDFEECLFISDFGLSKIVGQNLEDSNMRNIFGVLPYIAPEVLCGEEYTKAADVYSFGIIVCEFITGFAPYYDVPHDINLARQICNGLRPKIPFHTPKLITGIVMRCWDARVPHRPTFEELYEELDKYHIDYKENNYKNNNEITIQIDNSENFPKNETKKRGRLWKWIRGDSASTSTTPYDYQTHPEAIYTSRILNYSNLPEPKNDENFEKELGEMTKSVSTLSVVASEPINMHST